MAHYAHDNMGTYGVRCCHSAVFMGRISHFYTLWLPPVEGRREGLILLLMRAQYIKVPVETVNRYDNGCFIPIFQIICIVVVWVTYILSEFRITRRCVFPVFPRVITMKPL